MGHALGLGHAGVGTGTYGLESFPTMRTCASSASAYVMRNVDYAAANFHQDGYGPMVANPGFEEGSTLGWLNDVGSSAVISTAASKNGSYGARLPGSLSGISSMSQYLSSFDGTSGSSRTITGAAWFRTQTGTYDVSFAALYRSALVPNGDPPCLTNLGNSPYSLPNRRLDQSIYAVSNWQVKSSGVAPVTTSWSYWSFGNFTTNPTADIDQFRMAIAYLSNSPENALYVDNAELRDVS